MTTEMKYFLMATLMTAGMMLSGYSRAEAPMLTLQVRTGQTAGEQRDGTLLAQGTVTYAGEHSGFRVWSDAVQNGSPERFILSGQRNSANRISVRLSGKNWVADTVRGSGIVLRSSGYSATFSVETDGSQTSGVDSWLLQLQAAVLLP